MIEEDDERRGRRPFFTPELCMRIAFLAMGAALCTMFWIATNDSIDAEEKGFQLVIGSSALAALAFFAGVGRSEGRRTRAEIRAMRAEFAESRKPAGGVLVDEVRGGPRLRPTRPHRAPGQRIADDFTRWMKDREVDG